MKAILVGNAASLLESENGHLIDEFDIVIRFNDCRIKGYEKHCGTKTDIVVTGSNKKLAHMVDKSNKPSHGWWEGNGCICDDYMETVDTVWYSVSKEWAEKHGITCEEIATMSNVVNFSFMAGICSAANPESPFFYGFENIPNDRKASPSAGISAIAYATSSSRGQKVTGEPFETNPCLKGFDIFITGFDGFSSGHYFQDNSFPKLPKDASVEDIEEQMRGIQDTFGHNAQIERNIVNRLLELEWVYELKS